MTTKTLRLILGDQLNHAHYWFEKQDDNVTYVLMELRQETDYIWHHIQKVIGFFAAMRQFGRELEEKGHAVIYLELSDPENLQTFNANCDRLIRQYGFGRFEYQLPDELRLDIFLKNYASGLRIAHAVVDTEHFLTTRGELGHFFKGKKTFLMESFYRYMRRKHGMLMDGNQPLTGKWNYDSDNRKKLPAKHRATPPWLAANDVSALCRELAATDVVTIGSIDEKNFIWPVSREQSLQLLNFFLEECLPLFGTYEDAMSPHDWSLYHSRLSFALNTKMLSPLEVVQAAIGEWQRRLEEITFNQLEGFVRQIIGWREYMRGIYWLKMPEFADLNFLNNTANLPDWYWTGNTKMHCLRHAIGQSLDYAYAHHIQRLMITGNFALLAGVHPDEVDNWYLGIYIDAIQWVEITNTRGMSQFADGGMIATKPYVSSAAYIDKMGHYCGTCFYDKGLKTGHRACPFNSLYWNFYDRNEALLSKNPRIVMMYTVWHKMNPDAKAALLAQAQYYLTHINEL